jgi:hypothetical protein
MLTILSALLGFVSSSFPEVVKLFQDRQDKKHELILMNKQIELQKMNMRMRLDEVRIEGEATEMKALYENTRTNVAWVDAFAGTVRPVLAYAFILMFILTKLPFILLMPENLYNIELIGLLWTESDSCIFSSIIAFYFGSRQFSKMRTGH